MNEPCPRCAAGHGPHLRRESVAATGLRGGPGTEQRLQLTVRDEASLFASHPPTGLRVRMLRARPARSPSVVPSAARSAMIDDELATPHAGLRRALTS